jgi:hypothetical protein
MKNSNGMRWWIFTSGAFFVHNAARHVIAKNRGKSSTLPQWPGWLGRRQINYSAAKGVISMMIENRDWLVTTFARMLSSRHCHDRYVGKITTDEKLKEVCESILLKSLPGRCHSCFVFSLRMKAIITGQLICVDHGYGMI